MHCYPPPHLLSISTHTCSSFTLKNNHFNQYYINNNNKNACIHYCLHVCLVSPATTDTASVHPFFPSYPSSVSTSTIKKKKIPLATSPFFFSTSSTIFLRLQSLPSPPPLHFMLFNNRRNYYLILLYLSFFQKVPPYQYSCIPHISTNIIPQTINCIILTFCSSSLKLLLYVKVTLLHKCTEKKYILKSTDIWKF